MRFSDLLALRGQQVVVELLDDDLDRTSEMQGLLVEADLEAGLILQHVKLGVLIIPMAEVCDVEKAAPRGKIVRRTLRTIPLSQAKQHLLDRHGLQWDITRAMTPKSCFDYHNRIDHSNLGHRHRPKEVE